MNNLPEVIVMQLVLSVQESLNFSNHSVVVLVTLSGLSAPTRSLCAIYHSITNWGVVPEHRHQLGMNLLGIIFLQIRKQITARFDFLDGRCHFCCDALAAFRGTIARDVYTVAKLEGRALVLMSVLFPFLIFGADNTNFINAPRIEVQRPLSKCIMHPKVKM